MGVFKFFYENRIYIAFLILFVLIAILTYFAMKGVG